MKPYGVFADSHFHSWDSFSTVDEHGVNSRLDGQLTELARLADEVRAAGGDTIYGCGDTFHTRGQISPLVLNPVKEMFEQLVGEGFRFRIISGNHDLERRDSERLSSAATALAMPGVQIINSVEWFGDDGVVMIPWHDKLEELKGQIVAAAKSRSEAHPETLMIHAPVNGVIRGLPDTGLDPAWLASYGFKHVFCGHYHNHKEFPGGVYSVGALSHNTWSDVGSRAGFLIVDDAGVHWRKSRLPEFLDMDQLAGSDPAEIELAVQGNYIRVKTSMTKTSEIEKLRSELAEWGARGILIRSTPKSEVTREGAVANSIKSGASIGQSVSDYVRSKGFANPKEVDRECQDILAEAGVAA